jgi:hypothetical protein
LERSTRMRYVSVVGLELVQLVVTVLLEYLRGQADGD